MTTLVTAAKETTFKPSAVNLTHFGYKFRLLKCHQILPFSSHYQLKHYSLYQFLFGDICLALQLPALGL